MSSYARIIEIPTNLTVKNIKINCEKNPEDEEVKKKPVKVEFVKSGLVQDSTSLEKKERSKQRDMKAPYFSPMSKVRPISNTEKIEKKFMSTKKPVQAKSPKKT